MPDPIVHDGFTHFPLPSQLQHCLQAGDGLLLEQDGTVTPGQLKKLESTGVLYELPWGDNEQNKKKDAAREVLTELKPHLKKWPGKEHVKGHLKIYWEGKDLVLEKGSLLTPEGRRNICIPRPFPTEPEAMVVVQNKTTRSTEVIKWAPSEAYMLENNVRIRALKGTIRLFLLDIRCKGPEDEVGDEGENIAKDGLESELKS